MMDAFSLTGKTILVTGASSGIGRQAAVICGHFGAGLFITGRDAARLNETLDQIRIPSGPSANPHRTSRVRPHDSFAADLTVESELDELVSKIPVLDGIIHCAGIVDPMPAKFIRRSDIDRMFGINFHVPVTLTGKILRQKKLADGASVLFLTTIAVKNPYFGGALYSASKAALEAYSKTLALEMVKKRIRSNCIMAGLVDTPMIGHPSENEMKEEALKRYVSRYPLGIGRPEDIANAIVFFMSEASRWITGTSLVMGGE